jgi:hypothetical protein
LLKKLSKNRLAKSDEGQNIYSFERSWAVGRLWRFHLIGDVSFFDLSLIFHENGELIYKKRTGQNLST